MIGNYSQGGRPTFIADIPFSFNDESQQYINSFYKVVRTLNYREVMALSRLYKVNYNSVYKWKYRMRLPRFGIMLEVIAWGKRGKPLRQIPAANRFPTVF